MASSMAEDLVCSVCLSLFQEPHMLRCGHNFCLSCLESCIPRGRKKGKCPECRLSFSRQEFMCNRVLANLAEKARQIQLDQESLSAAALVGLCDEHDEPLKLFCQQDLVPICVICQDLPQHWGHEFLPIKDAVKDTKEKPKPHRTRLGHSVREVSKDLIDQQQEMAKLEHSTEEISSRTSRELEVLWEEEAGAFETSGNAPPTPEGRNLHKEEQDLKKTAEEMKAENLQRKEDALPPLNEEVSSHTKMNGQFKCALEIANNFSFIKVLKDLMYRMKEFLVWMAKADYARMREEEAFDEVIKSNETQPEDEDYSEDGVESEEEEEDFRDWDVSEEEEEDNSGDWDITEEEDSGDWDISEEEDAYSGDWDISDGDGEVSEEEMDGDGEVSKEEDGDGEVSEEEDDGDGEVSEEEDGDGEVSEKEEEEEEEYQHL